MPNGAESGASTQPSASLSRYPNSRTLIPTDADSRRICPIQGSIVIMPCPFPLHLTSVRPCVSATITRSVSEVRYMQHLRVYHRLGWMAVISPSRIRPRQHDPSPGGDWQSWLVCCHESIETPTTERAGRSESASEYASAPCRQRT